MHKIYHKLLQIVDENEFRSFGDAGKQRNLSKAGGGEDITIDSLFGESICSLPKIGEKV